MKVLQEDGWWTVVDGTKLLSEGRQGPSSWYNQGEGEDVLQRFVAIKWVVLQRFVVFKKWQLKKNGTFETRFGPPKNWYLSTNLATGCPFDMYMFVALASLNLNHTLTTELKLILQQDLQQFWGTFFISKTFFKWKKIFSFARRSTDENQR